MPSDAVAALFRQVMQEPEFAIMESTRKPNGLNGKFAPFYNAFGTYTI